MSKKRNYLRKAGSVWTAVFLLACSVCVHTSANAVETESAAEDGAWTDEAAVTINGTDYDLAHFNYYFQSWYDSFSGENAAMLPYMFDQSRSLKEQEYEDGRTWFDYFIDEASVSMQQIVTLAEEAKKADYKLDKEAEEEIGRVLEAVSGFAGTLGMDAIPIWNISTEKGWIRRSSPGVWQTHGSPKVIPGRCVKASGRRMNGSGSTMRTISGILQR